MIQPVPLFIYRSPPAPGQKRRRHPHTDMAKVALNMLTRTRGVLL
jgi:hypothetical protein